ncbi:hypothetical protein JM83_3705 [Gillisia sp. Hel_I_86]|nr:hypothetical protein JM83_3705 [Gillisia sp. Hel_I_86]
MHTSWACPEVLDSISEFPINCKVGGKDQESSFSMVKCLARASKLMGYRISAPITTFNF